MRFRWRNSFLNGFKDNVQIQHNLRARNEFCNILLTQDRVRNWYYKHSVAFRELCDGNRGDASKMPQIKFNTMSAATSEKYWKTRKTEHLETYR